MPKYLIGDFAFMIFWDERKQVLFGARDFSGSLDFLLFTVSQKINLLFVLAIQPLFIFTVRREGIE